MSAPFDRVIIGEVVTSDAILPHGYVAVRGETIAAIGEGAPPPATEIIDHSGRLILPGLVDGHMHTSSSTGWPGIETATKSAAAGGVTTCVDMPYDVPRPVTDAAILADKIGWVERTAHVDMALYGTITKAGGVGAIPGLAAGGISAFKLSTYEYDAVRFPRIDHPTMLAAFREIAKTGLPVAIHNEDQELVEMLTAQARAEGRTEPIMHCRTRPPLAETMADLEIFEMALETGAHVHIAHSSLARGLRDGRGVPRHGGGDHRRGLHPVSLHDRGRHRPAGRQGEVQSAVPHRRRGGADVAVPDGAGRSRMSPPITRRGRSSARRCRTSSPTAPG